MSEERTTSNELVSSSYRGDLGAGLIRRWSTAADIEKIAVLMGTVHRDERDELPNPRPMSETRLTFRPSFPYMTAGDAAVVEDTSHPDRPLVACTYFWRLRWSYAGIPFGATRPEMVVTLPSYRKRGLIRALFEMIHARSAAEGHLLQAITGIAYFYRQFGYDYVLDLEGGRTTYFSLIPEKKGDEAEACGLRLATLADVEQIAAIYDARRASSLVWHEAQAANWRHEIDIWDDPLVRDQDLSRVGVRGRFRMIVDAEQRVAGYIWMPVRRWSRALNIYELGFVPRANLPVLLPSLLRVLRDHALSVATSRTDTPPAGEISFVLGRDHPIYDVLGEDLAPRVDRPYAWYVRMPDVPAFLRLIAPALEERLATSPLAGYTGSPRIDLYREVFDLRFEQGKLVGVESIPAPIDEEDEQRVLSCPPLTFPQLVLGYRDVGELRAFMPDVWVKADKRLLIDTLFPKQPSFVDPLG